jgi:hypothetical protein
MNPHVPSMSLWLILAVICWFIAALHGGFYGFYAQANPSGRWIFGPSIGWLGMFFFGLFMIFH